MRHILTAGMVASLVACSAAAQSPPAAPEPIRYEHAQPLSKVDVRREMEYRELRDALDKARQNLDRLDAISGYPPY